MISEGKTHLVPRINSRKRTFELSDLLATSTTKQIIIAILYKRSVVMASRKLIGIITKQGLLAGEEIISTCSLEAGISFWLSRSCILC